MATIRLIKTFFIILLTGCLCPVSGGSAESDCSIVFFLGDVSVRTAGTGEWEPAYISQVLNAGDAVRTRAESRVDLGLADGSAIKINEKSLFEVKDVDPREQRHTFKLLSGKFRATVKKLTHARSDFQVESPIAIAAIRGTDFGMQINPAGGKEEAFVLEGMVDYRHKGTGGRLMLGTGQGGIFTPQGMQPVPIGQLNLRLPTSAPSLQVRTDLLSRWTNRSSLNITGQVSHPVGTDSLTVTVNGEKIDFSGNSFDRTCYLEDGDNALPVTVTDNKGNNVTTVVEAFYDRLAPNVVITRPAAGAKEINFKAPPGMDIEKTYTVTGFIMDPEPSSGIESVIINGRSVSLARDNSFSFDIDGIIGGETFAVDLEIVVRDRAGNETVDTSRRIEFEWIR